MKRIALVLALATVLRADSQHILRASFPDGTGLEIFTQSTGSTQVDWEGIMGIGMDAGNRDVVNRVVTDSAYNELFAYNLEASRGASPNTVMIRILPINAVTEAGMLKRAAARGRTFPGGHLPTVAAVREFPAVKFGEVVTLDILYNPATGEKIFDVLRPIAAPTSGLSVSVAPARETISLKGLLIRINGRPAGGTSSWMIGAALRIDLPRLGTYVVAAYDPHGTSPEHAFAAIAHAEGKKLSWTMDGAQVEITSTTNVLTQAESGVLWVYHDAHYRPDAVGLQSADTVDWLFPRR